MLQRCTVLMHTKSTLLFRRLKSCQSTKRLRSLDVHENFVLWL